MAKKNSTREKERELIKDTKIAPKIIIIAVCFVLGVLDMIMLREAMEKALDPVYAVFTALALATVANFTAFLWGMSTGKHLQKHSVNKYSVSTFLIWVLIGIVYGLFRGVNLYTVIQNYNASHADTATIVESTTTDDPLLSNASKSTQAEDDLFSTIAPEIVQIVMLTALYIGTGLTISECSSEIFDYDVQRYRRFKKEFEESTSDLANMSSDLDESLSKLENYNINYTSLEEQTDRIRQSIYEAVDATMIEISKKTKEVEPDVDPQLIDTVRENYLNQVKTNNAK